ncbi:MAG: hypothetical protein K2O32_14960 [Acetatifactor sp.]|nr:hypothetical protein [Acetatifactor sp.]
MVQYEMFFTNEYIEEIVTDLANAMQINFSLQDVDRAMQERDKHSVNNVLFLKKGEQFICIDCNDKDWIFPLVVRCDEQEKEKVKEIMMKWDNLIRAEYNQKLTSDIYDVYGKEDNFLKQIEDYYNVAFCSIGGT